MFKCVQEKGIKCRAVTSPECKECPVNQRTKNLYTCKDWLNFYNYVEELEGKNND